MDTRSTVPRGPSYPAALRRLADGASILASCVLVSLAVPSPEPVPRGLVAAAGVALFHAGAEATGAYRSWRGRTLLREVHAACSAWGLVAVLLVASTLLTGLHGLDWLTWAGLWIAGTPLLLALWRSVARIVDHELHRHGRGARAVAIVGATPLGSSLASLIVETPSLGMRLVGFYEPSGSGADHPPSPDVVGDLDALVDGARIGEVEVVYVTLPPSAEVTVTALLHKLADTTCSVYVVPDLYVFNLLQARWTTMQGLPVVSVCSTPFRGVGGWIKRAEDLVLGSLFLAIAAIPMLLVAVAITLTSPGPVLFRQRRYGLNGQPIDVLKFRTMKVAEESGEVRQATRDDPRITPLGAFLRRTSLDELPQFFQVLSGSMSVVGPRPHAVAHNELYRSLVHGYMLRHKVKPGITGLAQVNGWRGETETVEKMRRRIDFDLAYMRDWGLGLDLKIILLTVFGAATHRNAY